MVRTGRARIATALAAIAVAGVSFTSPAAADPAGIVRVGATSALNSLDKTLTAYCPPGTVVTGGGGYLTAPGAAHQGLVSLDRLEPLNSGVGFTAGMKEVAAHPENWQLSTDAICAAQPPGWDVISHTEATNVQVATADCGSRNVIGVGGRIDFGYGDVVLDYVVPTADFKRVVVRGTPVAGKNPTGWRVTAFAVCANVSNLQMLTPNVPLSSTERKTLSATCPTGMGLYSAGAAVSPGSGQVFLSTVHPYSVHSFSAAADEDDDGYTLSWALLGYGICGS